MKKSTSKNPQKKNKWRKQMKKTTSKKRLNNLRSKCANRTIINFRK